MTELSDVNLAEFTQIGYESLSPVERSYTPKTSSRILEIDLTKKTIRLIVNMTRYSEQLGINRSNLRYLLKNKRYDRVKDGYLVVLENDAKHLSPGYRKRFNHEVFVMDDDKTEPIWEIENDIDIGSMLIEKQIKQALIEQLDMGYDVVVINELVVRKKGCEIPVDCYKLFKVIDRSTNEELVRGRTIADCHRKLGINRNSLPSVNGYNNNYRLELTEYVGDPRIYDESGIKFAKKYIRN